MDKTKILFSVPCYGKIDPNTTLAIAKISHHPFVEYMQVVGAPTDWVRNGLVLKLLAEPSYTHLMMMDDDIGPPDGIVDMSLSSSTTSSMIEPL